MDTTNQDVPPGLEDWWGTVLHWDIWRGDIQWERLDYIEAIHPERFREIITIYNEARQ
jgi:hypothetical protein